VQAAFQPLFGLTYTPASAAVQTAVVAAVQAGLIVWSTRATTRINNAAVLFEIVGIVELVIVLLSAAFLAGRPWPLAQPGLDRDGAPGGLVPLAGAVHARDPVRRLQPGRVRVGRQPGRGDRGAPPGRPQGHAPRGDRLHRARVRVPDDPGGHGRRHQGDHRQPGAVAFILENVLGSAIVRIFLAFICVSIFCCGLICMVSGSRLAWATARDRRLPGHRLIARVPRATGGPTWATLLVAAACVVIVLALAGSPQALLNLVAASTLLPAILYGGIVATYPRPRLDAAERVMRLRALAAPVTLGVPPLEGGVEDHATGLPFPAEQTATAVDVLTDLLAIELRIAHVVVATTGQGARFGAGTRTTVELLAP